jgi:hypothetical protein
VQSALLRCTIECSCEAGRAYSPECVEGAFCEVYEVR